MDTPQATAKGRKKHGAQAIMLADPDLAVCERLNLINTKALGPKGIGNLPIPTTILVDREGIVRWIDQADDYQIRSAPERVNGALSEALA